MVEKGEYLMRQSRGPTPLSVPTALRSSRDRLPYAYLRACVKGEGVCACFRGALTCIDLRECRTMLHKTGAWRTSHVLASYTRPVLTPLLHLATALPYYRAI